MIRQSTNILMILNCRLRWKCMKMNSWMKMFMSQNFVNVWGPIAHSKRTKCFVTAKHCLLSISATNIRFGANLNSSTSCVYSHQLKKFFQQRSTLSNWCSFEVDSIRPCNYFKTSLKHFYVVIALKYVFAAPGCFCKIQYEITAITCTCMPAPTRGKSHLFSPSDNDSDISSEEKYSAIKATPSLSKSNFYLN